jgi:hypothetical protein
MKIEKPSDASAIDTDLQLNLVCNPGGGMGDGMPFDFKATVTFPPDRQTMARSLNLYIWDGRSCTFKLGPFCLKRTNYDWARSWYSNNRVGQQGDPGAFIGYRFLLVAWYHTNTDPVWRPCRLQFTDFYEIRDIATRACNASFVDPNGAVTSVRFHL